MKQYPRFLRSTGAIKKYIRISQNEGLFQKFFVSLDF